MTAITGDTGAECFEPGQFIGLGTVRHDAGMDAVLPLPGPGTFTTANPGPVRPGAPTTQKGLPGISCLDHGQPVTALQNRAIDAASEQSTVTFRMEPLMLTPPSRLRCDRASHGIRPELCPDPGQAAAEAGPGRAGITGSADWARRDGCQSPPLHDPSCAG